MINKIELSEIPGRSGAVLQQRLASLRSEHQGVQKLPFRNGSIQRGYQENTFECCRSREGR